MKHAASSIRDANLTAWPAGFPPPPSGPAHDVDAVASAGTQESIRDAERLLAKADATSSSTVFVVGLGLGYVLDVLERRRWTGRVVAFEPDPALADAWLRRRDWREWLTSGRLTVLLGPSYEGLDRVIPSLDPERASPVVLVNPFVAATSIDASTQAVRTASRAWFGARANQEARRANAGRYLLNSLRNLPAIAAEGDAAALTGAFTGMPTLVVAAGPSLDRNLPDIVAYRDRVLLVAVDTALRPLLAAGVAPDLVVAVDPSEANARHLVDLPPCPNTCFVAEGSLDPEALRHFTGRVFFFRVAEHHPWPWLKGLGLDRGRLRAWGSVLTTAFDLTLAMGCDPIVFAGADLAFTGGRPYARGTTYEEDWRREQAWGQTLEESWATRLNGWPETVEPGVDGAPVRTAAHLRSFRDWIVTEAAKATGRTIVNATGGGILTGDGIQPGTLAEICGARPPISPQEAIASCHRDSVRQAGPFIVPPVGADVERTWMAFAEVSGDAIAAVLRTPSQSVDAAALPLPVGGPGVGVDVSDDGAEVTTPVVSAEQAAGDALYPGLSVADAGYLAHLAATTSVRFLTLSDPSQDLLAELRRESATLDADDALVVVDRLLTSVGAQVRRAVNVLLGERPGIWLEYRRFADRRSQLTVLRGGASRLTPPADEADAAKWDPAHAAVADSLVPLIIGSLAPASVVDVGCGAGFWLHALAAQGVATVRGITPRSDGTAVVSDLIRAPLDAIPDPDRRFDVCLCLEVIQRVTPEAQDAVITACTQLSDVVVFSSRVPGAPEASPHARPMPYWAAMFWRHGYVSDDSVRRLVEQRWSYARTVFDGMLVFRRRFTVAQAADPALTEFVVASAARAHDAWLQAVWWAAVPPPSPAEGLPAPPRSPRTTWVIPAARLMPGPGATRVFRFRTDAARWYLAHPAAQIQVLEDGTALPDAGITETLLSSAVGGWTRYHDDVTIRASDGSDPRSNGRQYAVVLPAHIAWAEAQPMADARQHTF